ARAAGRLRGARPRAGRGRHPSRGGGRADGGAGGDGVAARRRASRALLRHAAPTAHAPARARRAYGRSAGRGRLHARRRRSDAPRGSGRMTVATPPVTSTARAFSQDLTPDGVLVLTIDVPGEKVNTLGKAMMQELVTLLD